MFGMLITNLLNSALISCVLLASLLVMQEAMNKQLSGLARKENLVFLRVPATLMPQAGAVA